tara:strand:+ start:540 stop:1598 length:1059 start_codon:yes stop_codon:yes gene_type:complete
MLSAILSLAAPAILGPAGLALTSNAALASAIGGGIGSLLQGGGTEDVLKGAALGGLGGMLGGQLGGVDPKLAANAATPFAQGAGQGSGEFLRTGLASSGSAAQLATPQTIGQQAGIMSQLTRPEAVGAGLGGLLADSMIKPPEYEKKEKRIFPEGMAPEDTVRFPKDRDPNDTSEFDYRFAPNYMAEGGEIESMMSPMDAGIGGMMADGDMNDKELISSTIDVLQGEIIDTNQQNVILAQFVQQFGQEALKDLMQRVQSGEIPKVPSEGDGMIEGAGDGMSDMVPASMEGDQDVLLSDGEFVVPADVVSGIGNGSSDAGSNKLEDMMDRVRQLRTGGTTQPPAIPDEMMLPA